MPLPVSTLAASILISNCPVVSSGDLNVRLASHLSNFPAIVTEDFTWNFIELCPGTMSKTGACARLVGANTTKANRQRPTTDRVYRLNAVRFIGVGFLVGLLCAVNLPLELPSQLVLGFTGTGVAVSSPKIRICSPANLDVADRQANCQNFQCCSLEVFGAHAYGGGDGTLVRVDAITFLFRSGDRPQHQGMGHFQSCRVWLEVVVDPAGERRGFQRGAPRVGRRLHPAI